MNISNLLTAFTLSRGEQAQEVLVPVQSGAEFEAALALPDAVLPLTIANPPLPKAAALDALIAQVEVAAQEAEVAVPVSWQTHAPDPVESAEISLQPPSKPDDPVNFDAAIAYSLFSLPLPANEPKPSDAAGGALAVIAAQGPPASPDLQQADMRVEDAFALNRAAGVQAGTLPVAAPKPLAVMGERPALQAQPDQAVLTGPMIEIAAQTPARLADRPAEGQDGKVQAIPDKAIGQGPSVGGLERVRGPNFRAVEQGLAMQAPSLAAKGDALILEAVTKDARQEKDVVANGLGRATQAPSAVVKGDVPSLEAANNDASQGLDIVAHRSDRAMQTPRAAANGDVLGPEAAKKDAPQGVELLAGGLGRALQAPSAAAKGDASGLKVVSGLTLQRSDFGALADGAVATEAVAKAAIAAPESPNLAAFKAPLSPMDALPLLAALSVPDSAQGPRPARQTIARIETLPSSSLRALNVAAQLQPVIELKDLGSAQVDPRVVQTVPSPESLMKGASGPAETTFVNSFAPEAALSVTGAAISAAALVQPDSPFAPLPKAALTLHANMPAVIAHLHQGRAHEGHSHAELLMNPAELGRIRFDLITQGDQVQVTLSVERPETLDLLRANAEALRQELRAAGLNADTLNFGQWAQRAPSRDQPQGPLEQGAVAALPQAMSAPYVKPMSTSGLDLRL